ncbi:DUF6058 family natural product biosynthesis protein [Pseudoalteromonas sp. SMS1]|uniref:DUF6058 family natural product biosynthesis protein n=1 Tax=Pseudoalteromonas sp. SMS1 TaxID=2908894 RepID=UPI001F40FE65|nr:DUF6058 family natural product biosynthesis protein [Pseudoalteromonas sp. SMS1]MCF2856970.1 DUF6058 family natural product biosynthesis protein [Pseudoalteromonas sp. SMS1]
MELLDYLYVHFLSEAQLIKTCHIPLHRLRKLQASGVMPKPSYILDADITCSSFFGEHKQREPIRFYPKAYTQWLDAVKLNTAQGDAYHHFSARMQETILALANINISVGYEDNVSALNQFITTQWPHFLAGTYGLCTRTGLPEDIAKKEIAVALISPLLSKHRLSDQEEKRLITAMNILASSSPKFAPHERHKSQNYRLHEAMKARLCTP